MYLARSGIIAIIFLLNSSCSNYDNPYEAWNNGDYAAAESELIILARHGDPKALTHLGVMYHLGLGVEKNMKEAVDLYKAAADQGYAPGQYNYGLLLYEGKAVKQDYKKAYELFTQAAEQGHSKAKIRADDMIVDVKMKTFIDSANIDPDNNSR